MQTIAPTMAYPDGPNVLAVPGTRVAAPAMIGAVDERGARILYYALAVALAIVLALPGRPGVLAWAMIVLGGVGATILRSRWLHVRGWSRTDLSWGALFAAVFLPLALLLRTFPFDR